MNRKSIRASRRVGKWVLVVAVALAVTLVLCNSLFPEKSDIGSSIAGAFPKLVYGHVYDSMGSPVVGSTVNVTIKLGSIIRQTLTDTTNSTGGYDVTFAGDYWYVGDTIEVNATYGSMKATNSTTVDNGPMQMVDVHFSEAIPEFSGGMVIVVMMVTLALILRSRVRR